MFRVNRLNQGWRYSCTSACFSHCDCRHPHTGYQVRCSVGAEAALSLIDAIPFCAAAFEV